MDPSTYRKTGTAQEQFYKGHARLCKAKYNYKMKDAAAFVNDFFDTLNSHFAGTLSNKVPDKIVFSGQWDYVITDKEHAIMHPLGSGKNKSARIFIHEDHAKNFPSSREKLRELVAHEMIHAYLYIKGIFT